MINLLPQENKETIKQEYMRRLSVIAALFIVSNLIVGIIILLPYSYSLQARKESYEQQLELSETRLSEREVGEVDSFVSEINSQLSVLSKGHEGASETSRLLKKVLSLKLAGVKIDTLNFSEEEIALDGESATRNNLLDFIETLEGNKEFKTVNSPVSNLLKDKDLDFSIKIGL